MVFSSYVKQRILSHDSRGLRPPTIAKILLEEEGIKVSRKGILKFLSRYRLTDTVCRQPGSGRPSKLTEEMKAIVEHQMQVDDETTAHQLHALLLRKCYNISISTVLRCRSSLGWTFRGSAYCQLIREVNKDKRLAWAKKNIGGMFLDVIYTDETSIQLETHRRFCCRKRGQRPRPKPR